MHVVKKGDNQRWYRGYGPDQYVYYAQQGPSKYLGGTFEVESYEELQKYDELLSDSAQKVLADSSTCTE